MKKAKRNSNPEWVDLRFQKYVERLAEYFRGAVFAGEYALWVVFREQLETPEHTPNSTTLASIRIDPNYLNIEVYIGKALQDRWREGAAFVVAECIAHEFCHLLLEELYKIAETATPPCRMQSLEWLRERQTTRISRALLGLVPDKVWRPQKGEVYAQRNGKKTKG